MAISEKDIKKLWGLSAGMCSYPGCAIDCIPFVDVNDPTLLGEMAHVIARQPSGARGQQTGGSDDYSNLILLCPTHHTLIDKSPPGYFSEDAIIEWKAEHENKIRSKLSPEIYVNKSRLCKTIARLLIENRETWSTYGPDSAIASSNPVSNIAYLWSLRKLSYIIPRNTRISNLIQANSNLFSIEEYPICVKFIEHAAGFEQSAYDRLDTVPRFPIKFEEMIRDAIDE